MLKKLKAKFYLNLANKLVQKQRFTEAIPYYKKAIAHDGLLAEAYKNLGNLYFILNNRDGAIQAYQQIIAFKPDYAPAYNNLANVQKEKLQLEAALANYRKAIALEPDYGTAHWNLALVLLMLGKYEEGWREYEWRWRNHYPEKPREFNQPAWQGEPLQGKTILAYAEQGLGDCIQFSRFIPLLKNSGAEVIFECPKPLARLMETLDGVNSIIKKGDLLPDFDYHVALMSLPYLLGITLDNLPAPEAYLDSSEALANQYKDQIPQGKYKVGIVWAGNPAHGNDQQRSCRLADFETLASLPHVVLYNLQKERVNHQDEALFAKWNMMDLRAMLNDFADTAAVIKNLDLVISVDTSVAHLSAALGKATFLILPYTPDWRWLLNRADSPWYPSMRIFRQSEPGNWASVFEEVKRNLTESI